MKHAGTAVSLRRLCRALLLPLLLFVAQQGAFLHALSHAAPAHTQHDEHGYGHQHDARGPCALCLAFAGVECAAGFCTGIAALRPGLRFAPRAIAPIVARAATVPAQRSRGPPFAG